LCSRSSANYLAGAESPNSEEADVVDEPDRRPLPGKQGEHDYNEGDADETAPTTADAAADDARLTLARLDPQVPRELRIIPANLLDEALGVLATRNVSIALPASPDGLTGLERVSMTAKTFTPRA